MQLSVEKDLLFHIRNKPHINAIINLGKTDGEKGFLYEKLWDIVIKLGYVEDLSTKDFYHYEGNVNTNDLHKLKNLQKYLSKTKIFGGSGGASDITLKNRKTKEYTFISCKYFSDDEKKHVDNYGIEKINSAVNNEDVKYAYSFGYNIYLFVKDKKKVKSILKKSKKTSEHMKNRVEKIFDVVDLQYFYSQMRKDLVFISFVEINDKYSIKKPNIKLLFHQKIAKYKYNKARINGYKKFLIAFKSRSGKTVFSCSIIAQENFDENLIITPAPKETIPQFEEVLDNYNDFKTFNILKTLEKNTGKNIRLHSKQFFDNKKKLDFLEKDLGLLIFDENHYGGTTKMSEEILKNYTTENTIKIFMTATYNKTLNKFNIPEECQFYWDIEDEMMCKNRDVESLKLKHNLEDDFEINIKDLEYYDKMPHLEILTSIMQEEKFADIKAKIKDTDYGFSMRTLFWLNDLKSDFKYKSEVQKFLRYISGSNKEIDYKNGDQSVFSRIKNLSIDSRTKLNNADFTSMIWFLPFGQEMPINKVSICLKKLMEEDRVLKNFGILIVNSKDKDKTILKNKISKAEEKAKSENRDGLIILAGNQCSLGITLPLVDVVFLLNDIISGDKIYQMMMRCMTEAKNKKYGIVVDFNMTRILTTINYIVNENISTQEKIKKIIDANLIGIDSDLFKTVENKTKLIERLIAEWVKNPVNSVHSLIKSLIDDIDISKLALEEKKSMKKMFAELNKNNRIVGTSGKIKANDNNQSIPSGIKTLEKEILEDLSSDEEEKEMSDEELLIWLGNVYNYIIPLMCALKFGENETNFKKLLKIIKENENLRDVFKESIKNAFSEKIDVEFIFSIADYSIFENVDIDNCILKIKTDLVGFLENKKELLNLIQELLVPRINEKRKFGEVFTPMWLIEKMLDNIDENYKKNNTKSIFTNHKLKWLDPANGIGNFMIAIYYRLMEGLKEKIPNEKRREKYILKHMLYMSELNKKNVVIFQQIFGIDKKLNLYCGDTLLLDTKKEWGVKEFDIVVGNPPYNEELKKSGAKPLYNKFIEKFIDNCGCLSFIVPSRWFSGGKGLDNFRKNMLSRKDIVSIKHFDDASKIFGTTVSIEGGVSYFLKNKEYNGKCNYNGSEINLQKYDILIGKKYRKIISKIDKYDKLTKLYKSSGYFGPRTNDCRLVDKKKNEDYILCFVSKQKGFEKYISKKYVKNNFDFFKVITARANGRSECFGNIFVGNTSEIHTDSYISFKVNNKTEAKSLESYLKCKLPNLLLSLRKISQDISETTCKWIPLVPLDRIWTDEKIYKYFEFDDEQVEMIKNTKLAGYKN